MKTYHMQSLEYNQKTLWREMQNEIGSFLPKLHFCSNTVEEIIPTECQGYKRHTTGPPPIQGLKEGGWGLQGAICPGPMGVQESMKEHFRGPS